jgi:tetratricopeptide (TPR) repeat protein
MAPFFRKVIGKTCHFETCASHGKKVELSETTCKGCNEPLAELVVPNRFRQFSVAIVTTVLTGGGYEWFQYFYPQTVQVQLTSPPGVVLETSPLSAADAERQLGARLREIYRDCKAGAAEKAAAEKLLAEHPRLAWSYPEVERKLLPHLLESCRLVRTGQTLVARGSYAQARADFLQATEEDPENANAWAALGGANVLTHREAEARAAYERALSADPESWVAHYNYGSYFARKGETEAAFLHLKQAVALLERAGDVDRAAVLDDLRDNPALDPLRRDPRFAKLLG